MVDQVIANTLGSYAGICQTPNTDNLSKEGVTFDNAYTPLSICSPARASIFTGKLPHRHGILYNTTTQPYGKSEIDDEKSVITHYLLNAGYKCGYVGKWHIGVNKGPREYGFEGTKHAGYGLPDFVEDYDEFLKEQGHFGWDTIQIKNPIGETDFSQKTTWLLPELTKEVNCGNLYSGVIDLPTNLTESGFVAARTIELLKKYKDKPFFITAAFWGPHHPAFPSPEFAGMHNPENIQEWKNFRDDLSNKPHIQKRYIKYLHKSLSAKGWKLWQKIIAAHFDFMSMIDFQIGKILNELKNLGLDKNTIVIFTSDHGDTLGCHNGLWDKGPYMYEETYKVPLIIRAGENIVQNRCSSFASNMDIFSTILDICEVSKPNDIDSCSLLPVIEGRQEKARKNVTGQFYGFDIRGMHFQNMIRFENYKYIFTPSDIDELYDLNNDPYELNNLIDNPKYTKILKELKLHLYQEMKTSKNPFADFSHKLMGL